MPKIICLLVLLTAAGVLSAQTYKWKDASGTISIRTRRRRPNAKMCSSCASRRCLRPRRDHVTAEVGRRCAKPSSASAWRRGKKQKQSRPKRRKKNRCAHATAIRPRRSGRARVRQPHRAVHAQRASASRSTTRNGEQAKVEARRESIADAGVSSERIRSLPRRSVSLPARVRRAARRVVFGSAISSR